MRYVITTFEANFLQPSLSSTRTKIFFPPFTLPDRGKTTSQNSLTTEFAHDMIKYIVKIIFI